MEGQEQDQSLGEGGAELEPARSLGEEGDSQEEVVVEQEQAHSLEGEVVELAAAVPWEEVLEVPVVRTEEDRRRLLRRRHSCPARHRAFRNGL